MCFPYDLILVSATRKENFWNLVYQIVSEISVDEMVVYGVFVIAVYFRSCTSW